MKPVYLFFAEGSEEVEALSVVDILRRGGVCVHGRRGEFYTLV